MIRLIFEVALARGDDGERAGRLGRGAALLAADRAFDIDADEIVVAGAIDAHVEGVVLFLIDERVGAGGPAEHIRLHPLAEQGRRVLVAVEPAAVVVGPDDVRFSIGYDIWV